MNKTPSMRLYRARVIIVCGGLLSALLPAAANPECSVKVVVFSAPEIEVIPAALLSARMDADELYQQMADSAAGGGAEIISDSVCQCGNGLEAGPSTVFEFPYPTEFKMDPVRHLVRPSSFTWRNCGISAAAEWIGTSDDRVEACIAITWKRTRFLEWKTWPMEPGGAPAGIEQPVFGNEEVRTHIPASSRRWSLAGVVRPASLNGRPATPAEQRTLLVFARAATRSEGPPRRPSQPSQRLHVLTFRVPPGEALPILRGSIVPDEVVFGTLLSRALSGEVQLIHQAAAGCLPGLYSGTESLIEFPHPTEFRPSPGTFTYRNTGSSLKLNVPEAKPHTRDHYHLESSHMQLPVAMVPQSPQPGGTLFSQPEDLTETLTACLPHSPGGILLAGGMLVRGENGMPMVDLTFLKMTDPPPTVTKVTAKLATVDMAVVSLMAEEIRGLPAKSGPKQWDQLLSIIERFPERLVAWQRFTGLPGTRGGMKYLIESPLPFGSKVKRCADGIVYPESSSFYNLGSSLTMLLPEGGGAVFDGKFEASLEPPSIPPLEAYMTAADNGTELPGYSPAAISLPDPEAKSIMRIARGPQIVSLTPYKPGNGSDGGGRWHAVVLLLSE